MGVGHPELCRHCGRRSGERLENGEYRAVFRCNHPAHPEATQAICKTCPDADGNLDSTAPLDESLTGMNLLRYDGRPVSLENIYRGATAFLILGGPSVQRLDLSLLGQRGCLLVSYNNNAAVLPAPLRPHVWLHTDPCAKFHDALWRDPTILKVSCVREWRAGYQRKSGRYKNIRRRDEAGRLVPLGPLACDMPLTFGMERNTTFDLANYLTEPSVNRGNDEASHQTNQWPHCINTMFAAVKLSYYLGIRRLILVGADFKMDPVAPYAFGQAKNPGGVAANNRAFESMNRMFTALRPVCDAAGYKIENATVGSGLTAFPMVDFAAAVKSVAGQFPAGLDCRGYYDE